MMREGIAAPLRVHGDMDIAQFARHRPDVSLLDLQMPMKDGLEAIVGIRALHPDARIVVLTTFSGDARVIGALKAGAAAYLLKDVPGAELAQTIRRVYKGASVIARVVQQEVTATTRPTSCRRANWTSCAWPPMVIRTAPSAPTSASASRRSRAI